MSMLQKQKILIIVESIDVNDSSGIKGRVALIKNLVKIGCEVLVYHYSRKDIYIPNVQCVYIKEQKWNVVYLLSRLQRVFTRITKININPTIESLFGFSFTFFNDVRSIRKALKKETKFQPDWILTLSKASSFRPHKAILGIPKWHSKWLAYVHDPFPMHSYPRPYDWVEPGHQFKRNFFLEIVDKAKYVVYPSELLAEWMRSYYPNQKGKEIIIPHQIASQTIESHLLPDYFDTTQFNLLHAGNMMSARNPIALIKAFELFLEENPTAKNESKLLFIGKPSIYDSFIKEKKQLIPELFLSDGYVPFEKVLAMQQFTSVNIILEALGPISPFLPGKFAHCIQAKKPILLLSPYYSESKRLLGDNYPYWSSIDDINEIKSIILELYKLWKEDSKMTMERKDLFEYLSSEFLQETISKLESDKQ